MVGGIAENTMFLRLEAEEEGHADEGHEHGAVEAGGDGKTLRFAARRTVNGYVYTARQGGIVDALHRGGNKDFPQVLTVCKCSLFNKFLILCRVLYS